MEIMRLAAVRDLFGLDGRETPEQFADMVYGVRFDFASLDRGYAGDLYIVSSDVIGEPLILIRRNGRIKAI